MQQQQIDFAEAKLRQPLAGRSLEIARCEMTGPDFRGNEHLVAPDAGGVEPLPDLTLVFVKLRGIEVPVAEPQCLLDDAGAGPAAQLPGAETEQRNTSALGFDNR